MNDVDAYLKNPKETIYKIDKILAEKVFYEFVKQAWEYIDPNPYRDNWHIKFLCDHIQAFHENIIENLIINIPPRLAKSTLCGVLYPCWVWINEPWFRFLTGSNSSDLGIRDCRKARILLASDWYQKQWSDKWRFSSDENTKSSYENDQGGFRKVFSMQGHVTGFHGDERLLDDPHDAKLSNNVDQLKKDNEWYDTVFSTRSDILKPSKTLAIMQRLSTVDFTGHILDKKLNNWTLLCLPWEFEKDRKCCTIIGSDPRTIDGEVLWNDEKIISNMSNLKKMLGSSAAAGQLQQRPVPFGGEIFKNSLFKYYTKENTPKFEYMIASLDSAWKEGNENDYSVITIWGIYNSNAYLHHMWRDRVTYPNLKTILVSIVNKYHPDIIYIEDAASGIAITQELITTSNLPIQPIKPKGDKVVRAHAVTPMFEQGRVFFYKDNDEMPNLYDIINELTSFPKGTHDDIVDSTTQALSQIFSYGSSPVFF